MSIKQTVASTLKDFPFDPEVGFLGQKAGERPCYHCLLSLIRDARVLCVVKQGSASCCLVCADKADLCRAIPKELLGAAQKIWNSYKGYVDSHRSWTGLQRWRIADCIKECISAFGSTYDVLLDPLRSSFPLRPDMDVIHAQELASQRKIMSLIYRVLAGEVHTPAEVGANLAAVTPTYIVNCPEADTLRNRLRLIDMCPDTATPSEKPMSNLQSFYMLYHAELMYRVHCAVRSGVSAPQVTDHTPA